MTPSTPRPFYTEVKDMAVCPKSEIDEILRKRDLVALREMLKNSAYCSIEGFLLPP